MDILRETREFSDINLRYFIYMLKGNSNVIINKLFRKNDFKELKSWLPDISMLDMDDIGVDSYGYFCNKNGFQNSLDFFFVNMTFVKTLISFYEYFESLAPIVNPMTVYRGCYSLEKDGLTGLVCTSTDERVAKSFERGLMLKINVPAGSRIFNVDCIPIDSNPEFSTNEHEIVLPPCDYIIKSEGKVPFGDRKLNFFEVDVRFKNLLEEFYKLMLEDKAGYTELLNKQQLKEFKSALSILKTYLVEHNQNMNKIKIKH